jgi:uncharacterized protein
MPVKSMAHIFIVRYDHKMLANQAVDQVVKLLDKECGLLILYLFGSFGTQREKRDSDIDLGVLVVNEPSLEKRLALQDDLETLLARPVDLVIMNHASPIIVMQILRGGKKLFYKPCFAAAEFEARALSVYYDFKRIRQPIEEAHIRKITHGR